LGVLAPGFVGGLAVNHDSARREDTPRLFSKGLANTDLLLIAESQALTVEALHLLRIHQKRFVSLDKA
jgi:hypothetical protein